MSTSPATTSPSKLAAFGGLKAFLPQSQQNTATSSSVTASTVLSAASTDAASASSTSAASTSAATTTHSPSVTATTAAPTDNDSAMSQQSPRRRDTDAALSAIDSAMSGFNDTSQPTTDAVEPITTNTDTAAADSAAATTNATTTAPITDNYTPPVLDEIESHWHYAVVCQYFELFRHYIADAKTYSFDAQQLLQALQCTQHTCDYEGVPQTKLPFGKQHVVQCKCSRAAVVNHEHVSCCEWLADTHIQLLQLTAAQPNTVHLNTWQDHLRQTLEDHFNEWQAIRYEIAHPPTADLYPVDITVQPVAASKKSSPAKSKAESIEQQADEEEDIDESPLPTDMHYYQQPWQYKLTLLKYLCEWQLETNDVFRQAILELQQQQHAATAATANSKDNTSAATPPSHILGEDDHGNRYYIYMVGDNTARAHLYLEPYHNTDRRLDAYRKGGIPTPVTQKDDKPAAADKSSKQEKPQNGTSRSRKLNKPASPTAASKKSKHRSSDADSESEDDATPQMNGKSHSPTLEPPTTPPGLQLLASTWQELTDLTQIWQAEYSTSTKFQQMLQRLQTEVLPELEKQEKAGRRKQRQVGSRRELADLAAFAYEPRSTRTRGRPVSYAEDALAPEINDEYTGPRGRAAARTRRNYNEDNDDDEYADHGSEDDEPNLADEELAKALANPYSTRRKRQAQVEYGEAQSDEEEEQQVEEEQASSVDDIEANVNVASITRGQPSTDGESEAEMPITPNSSAAPAPHNDILDSRPLGSLHQYVKQQQQQQHANGLATDDASKMAVDPPPTG